MDLNRTRAAEKVRGHIRCLCPDFQNPAGRAAIAKGEQTAMDVSPMVSTDKAPWPKTLPEQIAAVRTAHVRQEAGPPRTGARQFLRGRAGTCTPRRKVGPFWAMGAGSKGAASLRDPWGIMKFLTA
ncbi:MAG: hypothetical protein Q7J57_16680 [Gemmobacter sp.]|nr:hypothetical protein [Gemmobacter sp.]